MEQHAFKASFFVLPYSDPLHKFLLEVFSWKLSGCAPMHIQSIILAPMASKHKTSFVEILWKFLPRCGLWKLFSSPDRKLPIFNPELSTQPPENVL